MSEPKWTPGPWAICTGWPTMIVRASDHAHEIAIAQYGDFARTGGLRSTREQAEANANLIAAAPELYEALSGAFEWYEAIADDRTIEPEWVNLARIALTRLTWADLPGPGPSRGSTGHRA